MDDGVLDAGDFGTWLAGIDRALAGGTGTSVPCGTCTACCTASQFVHIGPDETDTLAHIPSELLFPAPLLPRGQMVLGYDEEGRCPMLGDAGCTIYEHRPRTCRTYDCRLFAAAEVEPDDDRIAARARRWCFTVASPDDDVRRRAIARGNARAATRLAALDQDLDHDLDHDLDQDVDQDVDHDLDHDHVSLPASPTQRAVLAVELREQFVGHDPDSGAACDVDPPDDALLAAAEPWSPVR